MLASRTFRVNTTSGAASAGARTICLYRSPALQQQRTIAARGFGKDAVEGWLDLAKLVASEGGKSKSPYEELAYQIGAVQWCGLQECLISLLGCGARRWCRECTSFWYPCWLSPYEELAHQIGAVCSRRWCRECTSVWHSCWWSGQLLISSG
eukprot:GHRQ01004135.1.p1 GENE.GHRQ01004135.1~~GHRQ01004135.1.p1  ORF type:complete len:152 (+),score=20.67 GHRQ01004135.1:191-646(+)